MKTAEMGLSIRIEYVFYLTTSWAGHVHIKSYLTVISIWTWWPLGTLESQHIDVEKNTLLQLKHIV